MQPAITRLSSAEFNQLDSDYPFLRELLDGEIILSGSPVPEHQDVVLNTAILVRSLIPDGKVMIAPMSVQMTEMDVPQPDVFWASAHGGCIRRTDQYYGAPDLIVEVLSPSTAKRDKDYKFRLYERVGVREYWLVDPIQQLIEIWSLVNGRYARASVFDMTETFEHSILGQPVRFATLFG